MTQHLYTVEVGRQTPLPGDLFRNLPLASRYDGINMAAGKAIDNAVRSFVVLGRFTRLAAAENYLAAVAQFLVSRRDAPADVYVSLWDAKGPSRLLLVTATDLAMARERRAADPFAPALPEDLLRAAFIAGFAISAEGFNGEHTGPDIRGQELAEYLGEKAEEWIALARQRGGDPFASDHHAEPADLGSYMAWANREMPEETEA